MSTSNVILQGFAELGSGFSMVCGNISCYSLQSLSYCRVTLSILLLMMYKVTPKKRKITPNTPKMIMVDPKLGTGRQAGNICYLNFDCLSLSILSWIAKSSSSEISAILTCNGGADEEAFSTLNPIDLIIIINSQSNTLYSI